MKKSYRLDDNNNIIMTTVEKEIIDKHRLENKIKYNRTRLHNERDYKVRMIKRHKNNLKHVNNHIARLKESIIKIENIFKELNLKIPE